MVTCLGTANQSTTQKFVIIGSVCGSVGRAVTSNITGPLFKSNHWQTFILNIFLLSTVLKRRKYRKWGRERHIFLFYDWLFVNVLHDLNAYPDCLRLVLASVDAVLHLLLLQDLDLIVAVSQLGLEFVDPASKISQFGHCIKITVAWNEELTLKIFGHEQA